MESEKSLQMCTALSLLNPVEIIMEVGRAHRRQSRFRLECRMEG